MSEYIRPDIVYPFPLDGGEILLGPSIDTIHTFSRLGAAVIKFYDNEERTIKNIWIDERHVRLMKALGFAVAERDFITETEYNQYLEISAENLRDEDFL